MHPEFEHKQLPQTTAEFVAGRTDLRRSNAAAAELVIDGGLTGDERQRAIHNCIEKTVGYYQDWHASECRPGGLVWKIHKDWPIRHYEADKSLARLFTALAVVDLETLKSASPHAFMYEFANVRDKLVEGSDDPDDSSKIRRASVLYRIDTYYNESDVLLAPVDAWNRFREHKIVKNNIGELVDEAEDSQYDLVCTLALQFKVKAIDSLSNYPRETTVELLSAISTALSRSDRLDDQTKARFLNKIKRTLRDLSVPESSSRLGKYGRFARNFTSGSLLPFADPDFAENIHDTWKRRDKINEDYEAKIQSTGEYDLNGYLEAVRPLTDSQEAETAMCVLMNGQL
ncbi:hypothetical protein HYS00_04325 [Candidatus Microgenomates bacterium]|nr:hypothetical protein [Candidatus Microgenomates bacterium]